MALALALALGLAGRAFLGLAARTGLARTALGLAARLAAAAAGFFLGFLARFGLAAGPDDEFSVMVGRVVRVGVCVCVRRKLRGSRLLALWDKGVRREEGGPWLALSSEVTDPSLAFSSGDCPLTGFFLRRALSPQAIGFLLRRLTD